MDDGCVPWKWLGRNNWHVHSHKDTSQKLVNSRFLFDRVLFLDINFHKLKLTWGSSYLPSPDWLSSKKAIINSKDEEDKECFKWGVLMALHHENIDLRLERISKLGRYEGNYNWRGLEFPLLLSKISIFEKNNNVSVNVLTMAGGKEKPYILRKTKFNNQRRTTNLLPIVGDEKKHCVTIKNLSLLLVSSNSSNGHQQYFCLNCLWGFLSKKFRNKHFEYCIDHKVVRIDIPKKNSFVRFHSGKYHFKVSFVIYIDFEAILQSSEKETNYDPLSSYKTDINHYALPTLHMERSRICWGSIEVRIV